ncbi:hypothetical protein B5V46_18075 [Rhodovulum sp. MB263]|nr:hypothetical protein B5V46_18075 [Rhodovulum sp. MB263]
MRRRCCGVVLERIPRSIEIKWIVLTEGLLSDAYFFLYFDGAAVLIDGIIDDILVGLFFLKLFVVDHAEYGGPSVGVQERFYLKIVH